ncbi:hypothetical protein GS597_09085 [Synechococcales cyanobacterium C]|uniref:Uncharacterized protein n=1 Tax=Petrachloros mirabilis ULC683 TaxID=2781853 RepID=A0A8K1ZZ75_9CYAN|nr:hypothetical protein [Petrachloros mirabilis]NCJ06656.1 hypothetical protein [Petrachloros mirabilis ULC683]
MSDFKLSVEQEFELAAYRQRIQHLSLEQSHLALVGLYALMLERDAYYQGLLRVKWGIGDAH